MIGQKPFDSRALDPLALHESPQFAQVIGGGYRDKQQAIGSEHSGALRRISPSMQ